MEYLVLDVGGSAIKYALMNDELDMLEKGKVPTPKDSLDNFKAAVKNYMTNIKIGLMELPCLCQD